MNEEVLSSRRLSYFREVATAGSFRLAAFRIGISQPVLTRQIQCLEQELGVVLLQRNGQGARPTEAGTILLERAEKILGELESTRALLASIGATPTGTTSMAMLTTFSSGYSAGIINRARETMPNVRVRTTEGTSHYVEERLLSGQADVGILIKRPPSGKLLLEDLISEEFAVFGPVSGVARGPWTFTEIASVPLVLPLPARPARRLIDEAARKNGIVLNAQFEVDSPYVIRDLIVSGGSYAVLPGFSLRAERMAGTIATWKIVDSPVVEIAIATVNGTPLSTAARSLANCIRRTVLAARKADQI